VVPAIQSNRERVSRFVGREPELEVLLSALDKAQSGRGAIFLIGGEPGIGKSRLADEFAGQARERGAKVLWGRAWEEAGAPAYWPWIQAFRAYLRGISEGEARDQLGAGAADIAQILPEVRTLIPDVASPPGESDAARFQLFDSTTTFLRNIADKREAVLVLDDLHAADTPSILLLRFVASQLSDMRLLAIGTYRDIELSPEHPLTGAIGDMAREPATRLLSLGGLPEEAADELIESAASVDPSDQLVHDLWRETKGNPLFLGETVRLLAAEGRLNEVVTGGPVRLAIPAGIRDVITRRVRQLSEDTVHVLTVGAALGPEFSAETLRRVGADDPVGADDGADLLSLLDEAIGAGLVSPLTGAQGRFRFSHDLIRESLYQEQSHAERVRLHARIAEVLEEMYQPSLEAHLAELAYHYSEAAQGAARREQNAAPDPVTKARAYARRAGDVAAAALAFEEAARLYRLALTLLDPVDTPDDEARTELLLAIGEAHARSGDIDSANAAFLQAAELARRTGVAAHLATAALGIGGRVPWARPGTHVELIPMLQEALRMLGGSDDRLRVRLLARLACAWRSSPEQRQQSDTLSRQALELARQLDDPSTLSYALAGRYWATWWPENPKQRLPLGEEMIAVAEAAGDAERLIDANLMLWLSHTEVGRTAEAERDIERINLLAEKLRQPTQRWLGTAPRAMAALMVGDFRLAEGLVAAELEPGPPTTLAFDNVSAAIAHLFLLRRTQGRPAEAESAERAAVDAFPWYPLHRAALALLLLDLGRELDARELFDALAEDEFRILSRDNEWLLAISLAGEACSLLHDATTAEVLYRQLLPFAGRHAAGYAEGSVGAADRYLGLLCTTLGRIDDAIRHLDEAVALNERLGARPWAAHSRRDLAQALRLRDAPGDRDRAIGLERLALDAARQMGMTALQQRIEADPSRDMAPAAAEVRSLAGTFRREGEYWTIAFGEDGFRLRDTKGVRYLARLLSEPGREILALALAGEGSAAAGGRRGLADPELERTGLADGGEQLDHEAKDAYRQRLRDLQEEIDEAETWNDPERADRARVEMDFLVQELSRAVGLGGRDRPVGSATERARLSVTRAIRSAIERIAENSAALGEHLETTIHTGTYCSYHPDSRMAVAWRQ
jgi:tetratricopeptide (TPR) repeat protein